MGKVLAKMFRRRPADLLLAAEAMVLLAFFRVCLAVFPARPVIRGITHGLAGDAAHIHDDPADEQTMNFARRVRWAVSAIARHSVVEFVCFPQALAGYAMMRLRGVPSTIVYGVARSAEGELMAHAWLTTGDWIILGGEEAAKFTAVERWR